MINQYESMIISVITGIIVVVLVEFSGYIKRLVNRRCEIGYIRNFFRAFEKEIKDTNAITSTINETSQTPPKIVKNQIQLAIYQEKLRAATLIMTTKSSHLTAEQIFEILKIITDHAALDKLLTKEGRSIIPNENFYNQFFDKVRKLKWLKF